MNEDVIRCHFRAALAGGPTRSEQHRLFVDLYPDLSSRVTVQHFADQFHFIQRRHLLSELEIENIKKQVQEQPATLEVHPEEASVDEVQMTQVRDVVDSREPGQAVVMRQVSIGRRSLGLHSPVRVHVAITEISEHLTVCFADAIIEFIDEDLNRRLGLPKFKVNTELLG